MELWENKGFSVNSGYHLARLGVTRSLSSSSFVVASAWWKGMWNLQILNKIKICLWRLLLNFLPTGMTLSQRAIDCFTLYPRWGQSGEDLNHAFWSCKLVRRHWLQSQFSGSLVFPTHSWFPFLFLMVFKRNWVGLILQFSWYLFGLCGTLAIV